MIKEKNEKNFNEKDVKSIKKSSQSSKDFNEDENSMLTTIQKTCLNFCLTLLNDHITCKKYDSLLIYTLMSLRIKDNE